MIIWYSIHTKILLRISYYKVFEGLWPFSSQVYSTETLFWIGPDNNSKTKLGNQKNYKSFFSKSHRKWEKISIPNFRPKEAFQVFSIQDFNLCILKTMKFCQKFILPAYTYWIFHGFSSNENLAIFPLLR